MAPPESWELTTGGLGQRDQLCLLGEGDGGRKLSHVREEAALVEE